MKIMLHNLVGHSTDYMISCSTGVLFAARPTTRLMSSQRVTCLDPVPCRAPLPSVQCTHYNLWCHHIKLGKLSDHLARMDKCINDSCKWRAECFTLVIIHTEQGWWLASSTQGKSAEMLLVIWFSKNFKSPLGTRHQHTREVSRSTAIRTWASKDGSSVVHLFTQYFSEFESLSHCRHTLAIFYG